MENTLTLLAVIQAFIIIVLVFYFLKFRKKDSEIIDPKNYPDFIKADAEVNSLSERLKMAQDQIVSLENDKKEQLKLIEDVKAYRKISDNSISNYKEVVNEYKDFHNKLIGDFKFQGNYNEKKLQDLLLKAGFEEGPNGFQKGKSEKSSDVEGDVKRQIPDFVISLPFGQKVVADCKVSLTNFKNYCNEKDPSIREKHLKAHIASVRKHITDLSEKDYTKIYSIKKDAFKYTLVFMPFDQVYLSALENDEKILDFCIEKKILLAGPLTMVAILSNIQESKNQIKQVKEVGQITKLAEDILDKYASVKQNLKNTISSYNTHGKSMKSLIHNTFGGSQSLENKIKKLNTHGVTGKTIA